MALIKQVPVDQIKIGKRHRRDMGNLQLLADSIEDTGLLHPIVVTKDGDLVCGERRLQAVRDVLGWDKIECRILDVSSIVEAEHHENEFRKNFTFSERVAIADAIKKELGINERRGRPAADEKEQNFGQLPKGTKTSQVAAERAGFGNPETYRQAKATVEKGVPELVAAMDKGDVAPSVAAKLAELPKSQQRAAVSGGKPAIRQAAKVVDAKKATANLPDGPTPHQLADESPERRWHATLHKLYVFMTSTRDLGGIVKLSSKWSKNGRNEYVAELKRIIGELRKWISDLESIE